MITLQEENNLTNEKPYSHILLDFIAKIELKLMILIYLHGDITLLHLLDSYRYLLTIKYKYFIFSYYFKQ